MMSWCGWWCCCGCPSSSFVQLLVRLVVLLRLLFLLVWLLGRRNDELVRLVVLLPLLFLLSGVAAALAYGCSCLWLLTVVVSFTGGRKSSAGMAKDRRPWSLGFLLLLYCPLASPLTSPSSP
jgi:hypothetical protein